MQDIFQKDYYRLTGKNWSIAGWFDILLHTNVRYVFYLRFLYKKENHFFYPIVNAMRLLLSRKTGIEIRPKTKIGEGFRIFHPYCIAINENATIGKNVNILKGATVGYANGKRPGCPKHTCKHGCTRSLNSNRKSSDNNSQKNATQEYVYFRV